MTWQDDWAKARTALKLDDRMGVISARDLSKHVITSAAGGLDLVKRATANRRVCLCAGLGVFAVGVVDVDVCKSMVFFFSFQIGSY